MTQWHLHLHETINYSYALILCIILETAHYILLFIYSVIQINMLHYLPDISFNNIITIIDSLDVNQIWGLLKYTQEFNNFIKKHSYLTGLQHTNLQLTFSYLFPLLYWFTDVCVLKIRWVKKYVPSSVAKQIAKFLLHGQAKVKWNY